MQTALYVAALMIMAAVVNVPLGYQRQSCRKFSFGWYFYIHISIPIIVYIRVKAGLSWHFIPFTVASAVLGQIIGGRLRRQRNDLG